MSLKRKLKWRPHSKIGSAEREEKVNNSLFLLPSPGSGPSPSVSQHRPSYRSRWMQLPTLGCQLVHTEHHFSHGRSQSSRGKGSGDAISNSQARGGGPERCSGKKSKIQTGEWSLYPSGWEWSSSPVITECANQVLCALQKHKKWLHTSKLFENPEILQISGMNYNYEDKCFRDFQSNSYLKRVQKLGKINRHPRNSPDRNSETCIKTFCFMGTRKGGWFPPGPAEGSRKVTSSQSANIWNPHRQDCDMRPKDAEHTGWDTQARTTRSRIRPRRKWGKLLFSPC